MKTVVIIDDDANYNAKLDTAVQQNPNYKVVAKAVSGRDGKLLIEHHKPDVIIMDMIMPDDGGLKVIKHIYQNYEDYVPYIVIVTGINTVSMKEMLLELEVDFVEFKPLKDKRLNEILAQIEDDKHSVKRSVAVQKNIKESVYDVIEDTLHEVGVSPELMGYVYMKTALYFIVDNIDQRPPIYDIIADVIEGTTKNSLDKNMRTAISGCVGTKLYKDLFGEQHVNNLKFLYTLGIYIKKIMRGSEKA